ncbi:hypothetical protein ASE66_28035 [Bosea sp. Root483D1]|nr:hypothetical protein ASE66_28035 [Bosea sp. Root483D1]
MPFASLSDPVEIARAHAALQQVRTQIERLGIDYHGTPDGERTRAAQIVVGVLAQPVADHDLVRLAVARFVQRIG